MKTNFGKFFAVLLAIVISVGSFSPSLVSAQYMLGERDIENSIGSTIPSFTFQLEAFQYDEPSLLVADGFADIEFSSPSFLGLVIPESFSVATPHLFTLSHEYMPLLDGVDFIGWVDAESEQVLAPGQTVLINGSGKVEFYAVWDFGDRSATDIASMVIPPTHHIQVDDVIEQMAGHWIWYDTYYPTHVILFADGRWEMPPNFSGSFWIAYEESGIHYLRLTIEHSAIPNIDLGFAYEDYFFDAQNNRLGMIVHSGEGTRTIWFTRE